MQADTGSASLSRSEADYLSDILELEGVHGLLRHLNQQVPHRFTGLYRFDPPTLRNVELFDRENPELRVGQDAPMRETYCSITATTESGFDLEDAQTDARVEEHAARDSTRSYCGVPVRSREGSVVGTLCHFDTVPRRAPAEERSRMHQAAALLAAQLQKEAARGDATGDRDGNAAADGDAAADRNAGADGNAGA